MIEIMDKQLLIERASIEDAENISSLIRRSFTLYQEALGGNIPVAALTESAADVVRDIAKNIVYVARLNGKVVGSIRCEFLSKDLGYIYRFGVDPDINNNGVGSGLLEMIMSDCKNSGIKAIALHTNSKYYKLARYYYGKGFYVHSTDSGKGYIRALFINDLSIEPVDISPAYLK